MHNALGHSLVDRSGSRGQLHVCTLGISFQSSFKLLYGSMHTTLHHAVTQVLLFADLDAFNGGLDVRQLVSPP